MTTEPSREPNLTPQLIVALIALGIALLTLFVEIGAYLWLDLH